MDATHTKSHTLLSWRMMAVATRNFVSVNLHSDEIGGTMSMTRTYNKIYVHYLHNNSRVHIPIQNELQPRQAGYMPYSPHMLVVYARHAARRFQCGGRKGRKPRCRIVGDMWSGINGRPLQRFVPHDVDLSRVPHMHFFRRPEWVTPLIHEFGETLWRSRYARLRALLLHANHSHVAFYADEGIEGEPGLNESLPTVCSGDNCFPARALVVPLGPGGLEVDYEVEPEDKGKGKRISSWEPPRWETHTLKPPKWEGLEMTPQSAPVAVPWGRKHAVRCVGRCSWMCVFGLNSGATKLEDAKTRLETLERLHAGLD